jgi:signal transduction histidine kinase
MRGARPNRPAERQPGAPVPDLSELCRIHEIGLDLIERSHDLDDLLDRVIEEYEVRLRELPDEALDARADAVPLEGAKKLRALVMFATQAAALKEKAIAAAELKRRAALLEEANARLVAALDESQRSRARLDGVVDALGSGLMILDESGAFVKANGAARAVTGGEDEAALAGLIRDGVPPGGEAEIELPACGAAGSRTLLIARRPMAGDPGTEVVLVTDVTQRTRDMEERVRLEKLAEVMRTLSVLSHKINNPLTALLGRAQILSSRKTDDPHVVKAVTVIEESSQRIAELIRELATVVREGRHESLDDILVMHDDARAREEAR